MSLDSTPNFAEYSNALRRLQNRAALRRAVMSAQVGGGAFEALAGDDQERRDRELLDVWERHNGLWLGY